MCWITMLPKAQETSTLKCQPVNIPLDQRAHLSKTSAFNFPTFLILLRAVFELIDAGWFGMVPILLKALYFSWRKLELVHMSHKETLMRYVFVLGGAPSDTKCRHVEWVVRGVGRQLTSTWGRGCRRLETAGTTGTPPDSLCAGLSTPTLLLNSS